MILEDLTTCAFLQNRSENLPNSIYSSTDVTVHSNKWWNSRYPWLNICKSHDLHQRVCLEMLKMLLGCVDMQLSYQFLSASLSKRCSECSPVFTQFGIHRISDLSRVLNLAVVGCSWRALDSRFPKKYGQENHPLTQGNHEIHCRMFVSIELSIWE